MNKYMTLADVPRDPFEQLVQAIRAITPTSQELRKARNRRYFQAHKDRLMHKQRMVRAGKRIGEQNVAG